MYSLQFPSPQDQSSMVVVGKFLDVLLQSLTYSHRVSLSIANHSLYSCSSLTTKEIICLIIGIFDGIPEPYRVLRCQSTTTENEVTMFWNRSSKLKADYLVLNFNKLPLTVQEVSQLL